MSFVKYQLQHEAHVYVMRIYTFGDTAEPAARMGSLMR